MVQAYSASQESNLNHLSVYAVWVSNFMDQERMRSSAWSRVKGKFVADFALNFLSRDLDLSIMSVPIES